MSWEAGFTALVPVLVSFGGAMFLRGWVGRRLNDAPHCRRCAYNLTGLAAARCPECGADLVDAPPLKGARVRRPLLMWVGVLSFGAGAAFTGWRALLRSDIDLYSHFPASWLITKASADDERALDELITRQSAGRLNRKCLSDAIEAGLVKQSRPDSARHLAKWCNLLARLHESRSMSVAQQERFLSQMFEPRVLVRPRIRPGDPLPFELGCALYGSGILPWVAGVRVVLCAITDPACREDAQNATLVPDVRVLLGALPDAGSVTTFARHQIATATDRFGPAVLVCDLEFLLLREDAADLNWEDVAARPFDQPQNAFWSRTVRVAAEFQIVEPDAPDPLELVRDAGFQEFLVKSALSMTLSARPRRGTDLCDVRARHPVTYQYQRSSSPCPDVIASLVARSSLGELSVGRIERRACSFASVAAAEVPVPPERSFRLIMRADPDAARKTIDVFRIWDGEIDLGVVNVKPKKNPR